MNLRRASFPGYYHYYEVSLSSSRIGVYYLLLVLAHPPEGLLGAWGDSSAGLPPVEITSARELGEDDAKSAISMDGLGRVFIGSPSLLAFDGQTWQSHPKPGSYFLSVLTPGKHGIIWAGTTNDLGYFREDPLGKFTFHSLLHHLPPDSQNLGTVWGCAVVEPYTYFISKDKLLRWDGQQFQITAFPGALRLSPVKLGKELWFQHLETGLYRITENGPELQFTANQLPGLLIIALYRDEKGVVTVSNEGLRRPGEAEPFSSKPLNEYLTLHRVSAFAELPDGNLAIGTLSGGLVLTTRMGEIVRIWDDSNSGLPSSSITSLTTDVSGEVLGTSRADFFHFPANGHVTAFNSLNGLRTGEINALVSWRSRLYVSTADSAYQLINGRAGQATFQAIPELGVRFLHIAPFDNGLLLARFGGVDWFDGTAVRPAYEMSANTAYLIAPSKMDAKSCYIAEVGGVSRLVRQADGSFKRTRFLELPDSAASLHEDATGRLWIGTFTKGAFTYDPSSQQLTPVTDPASGQPLQGRAEIAPGGDRVLIFLPGRVLQADPRSRDVRRLENLPAINATLVRPVPGQDSLFVAYQQTTNGSVIHGAGVISFAGRAPTWRELDLSPLNFIGSIRAATFSVENRGLILWLGGMEGVLRFDYDQIPTLEVPPAPSIKMTDAPGIAPADGSLPLYPFRNHLLGFHIFTGNYIQSRNWLFQTRLSANDAASWSAPSPRRSFEFTNLSEGDYRFEVRAVNPAGRPGPPAACSFRILPPWYRSKSAYVGYAAALLLAVFGFIRVRERRIRARNQELESLVNVRTVELVKANAAKDEFLAGISHEIRNPMNGVIGIAENFKTEGLDLENRRKFNLLRQCASHLSSLLEDILDFSKVQAGAIELDPKPFDLPELVESVAGITRADSEKYGIPVEVAVSPAVPRRLVGDARRIRQILINFVSNALKFSGRGQVSVTVWCKPAAAGQTEVVFAVSDEGPGISPEEQARLFTRFERGAAAQKGRVPGTGLGLALCKGLAAKMGGRIWLESELGRGSCFYFSAPFPVVEVPVEAVPAADAPVAAAARSALVVDDQEYNRIVLTEHLQAMGFRVHAAQEGQAALDAAARQSFDVIFLDFNLPGLSGVDVARDIRSSNGPSAHALMLATTAFTTPEKRAQCLDAGMDAFLGKPVTRERLASALAGLPPLPETPAPAPAAAAPVKSDGPADRLGNLRLLARKKGVTVEQELALYFSELDAELAQLDAAIQAEDLAEAGRFSHMLCGRCSFIFERGLEQVQRKVEAAIDAGQLAEARKHRAEFGTQLAATRVRLGVSGSGAVPPASGH